MAAPVQPIKASFNCPRRPLEKTCVYDWLHSHSTTDKLSFCIKANSMQLLLMSNLRLGGKVLSVAYGGELNEVEKTGGTAWAALRAAHASVGQRPLSCVVVSLFYQARTYFQSRSG
jgi:hypothetical protein